MCLLIWDLNLLQTAFDLRFDKIVIFKHLINILFAGLTIQ